MSHADRQHSLFGPFISPSSQDGPGAAAPPPSYEDATRAQRFQEDFTSSSTNAEDVNLSAAFDSLSLPRAAPDNPTPETCLAHLKLLFAIQWMKEDVGFADGVWGLWDSRAGPVHPSLLGRPAVQKGGQRGGADPGAKDKMRDTNLKNLSLIREKRWALFVARAVDRYESWWNALCADHQARPLSEYQIGLPDSAAYAAFTVDLGLVLDWREDMLPPLDVLMVWHTHMLNPRAFLEDAMLSGLRSFWRAGIPWAVVDRAIDTDFNYRVSDTCKARWTALTGRAWDNADDPLTKTLRCPRCHALIEIPWTTCGRPDDSHDSDLESHRPLVLSGCGYGDGNLWHSCPACSIIVDRELLSVSKFFKDTRALLGPENRPMPGTLLDPITGLPAKGGITPIPQAFPNRLLKSGCHSVRSLAAFVSCPKPTMDHVRTEIEAALSRESYVKMIDGKSSHPGRYRLPKESRIAVRKMMSRYWENFSMFALDLCGAVMRQGVFIEKMCKLDWLHSPSARDTMARLLQKYDRFLCLMKLSGRQMLVPTLDVDLAWHTHQLSPSRYFLQTVSRMGRFVGHDDKVEANTLSQQFEWTSKGYQALYGEVYSECTCWYCEAIRAAHISTVGKALGLSKNEKIAESFYTSGAASLHPPDSSAHISSHPSVQSVPDPKLPGEAQRCVISQNGIASRIAQLHRRRLDAAYARARARAEKKGRPMPSKREDEVYYDHWGYPYLYAAPYYYPLWWTPGLYCGWNPGYVATCGTGAWAACAAGTCGGGVAAGACGGPGSCGGWNAGGDGASGSCGGGEGGDGGGGGGSGGGCGGGGGGGCGG